MRVYEIRLKLYLLQSIEVNKVQSKVTAFLDQGFAARPELLEWHETNRYKNYCFDMLYPLEKDKLYKKGKIYTLTVRTIDSKLAAYFSEVCPNQYTNEIKGLTGSIRILPKKIIQTLYTLTPAIIKCQPLKEHEGYWRGSMSLAEYENRLKVNLIKKWNAIQKEKINEDFPLYTMLEFLNEAPIPMEYKNIRLLGDKLRLQIAEDELSQNIAYMALGTGLLEMNGRGAGYVNYRWL